MIKKLVRFGLSLYFKLGIMPLWSRLHAWIWERKTQAPLRRYSSIPELVKAIQSLKWRADTWRELWDAVSSIGAIQWRMWYDPEKAIGDCDEFGRYSACVIRLEKALGSKWIDLDKIDTSFLLTVMWKERSYSGHNVCLIRYTDGTWAYMDYGFPSHPRQEIKGVVREILHRYAPDGELVGYAFSDPDTLGLVGLSLE